MQSASIVFLTIRFLSTYSSSYRIFGLPFIHMSFGSFSAKSIYRSVETIQKLIDFNRLSKLPVSFDRVHTFHSKFLSLEK